MRQGIRHAEIVITFGCQVRLVSGFLVSGFWSEREPGFLHGIGKVDI
jgi:hypothetical protein